MRVGIIAKQALTSRIVMLVLSLVRMRKIKIMATRRRVEKMKSTMEKDRE
jgi:hypothetical protein